ncbi:PilZ domain-containing protein [Sphingomonas mollis]|uniref:PilZ domain-containing protein n=1 Tax=Sphingomonas mollis TaxID=2795726 RepID=A0ABS0XKX9_9SPHN|nr:PilZ domain-containing protein [Sphingomonas sp. BT553]MBJ6120480.1 PilZ domain-containing protein [Sphingomonas sp. BT553]
MRIMSLTAKLYREQDERIADRQPVNLGATVRRDDQRPIDVQIDDLSSTGFRMQSDEPIAMDSTVSIGIAGLGRHTARVVRQNGNQYGCSFLRPVSIDGIDVAEPPQTIVRADFGTVASPAMVMREDPPLDAIERRIRQFRGPIILTGLIVPWIIIGAILTALA